MPLIFLVKHLYAEFLEMKTYQIQSVKKRKTKRNTPVYSNTIYRREMKLVPINVDYCLLQVDALKFFLGVRLHGGLELTLILSMYTTKFFNGIVKFTSQIA